MNFIFIDKKIGCSKQPNESISTDHIKKEKQTISEDSLDNANSNLNIDNDNEDNKSVATSESGSVHLIVDETSIIIEPSNNQIEIESSLQSKPTIDSAETRDSIKNTIETMEQEKTNDSNPSMVNVSDENSQKPDKISQDDEMNELQNEPESKDEKLEEENKTDDLANKDKDNDEDDVNKETWALEEPKNSEDSAEPLKYASIKNLKDEYSIRENDFVSFENKNPKPKDAYISNSDCSKASNVYNELMDESSNTNYSIDENEKAEPDNVYLGRVESFWKEEKSDKLMMSIRILYKPEQLKFEFDGLLKETLKGFDKNELVLTSQIDVVECDSIRSKCVVYDNENYEK